jgi:hypothetical protein
MYEELLNKYSLKWDEIESILRERLACPCFQNPQYVERVFRFSYINKILQRNGVEPLLFGNCEITQKKEKKNEVCDPTSDAIKSLEREMDGLRQEMFAEIKKWVQNMTPEDIEVAKSNTLSVEQYAVIKGKHGFFLNLNLDKITYQNTIALLDSPRSRKRNFKDDDMVKYIRRRLWCYSNKRLRCPEYIEDFKNIYSKECTQLKILKARLADLTASKK